MLLARFLMIFATPETAVFANSLSALSSSFTILFLFWSITHLAKKMIVDPTEATPAERWAVMGAGVVGALAYTFSDSFWFSAVEGEVYALSSLFRRRILGDFEMGKRGRSTGSPALDPRHRVPDGAIHWGSLIEFVGHPSHCPRVLFQEVRIFWKGLGITTLVAVALLGFVQEGMIKGVVNLAAKFELFFVNEMGFGFNTGVLAYALFLVPSSQQQYGGHTRRLVGCEYVCTGHDACVDWVFDVRGHRYSKCRQPTHG